MFFRFPPDARWNPDCSAVEFGVGIGEYEGVVRVPRRVFQSLLERTPIHRDILHLRSSVARAPPRPLNGLTLFRSAEPHEDRVP